MKKKPMRKPTHPGKFLREEFLETNNITQADFADALNINRVTLSKILNARQRITPDVALRLSICLNTSAEVWLNMQTKFDLWEEFNHAANKKRRNKVQRLWLRGQYKFT